MDRKCVRKCGVTLSQSAKNPIVYLMSWGATAISLFLLYLLVLCLLRNFAFFPLSIRYVDSTTNPNFATAELNGKKFTYIDGNRQCGLQYYHYAHAGNFVNYIKCIALYSFLTPLFQVKQVPGTYANCHQNADSSCCKNTTVSSFAEINLNYGEYYHIDRCGTMSQACQNFFVMEACLYECDPTAGLYRKYTFEEAEANGTNATANNWQMYKMPIKKGFCDQW